MDLSFDIPTALGSVGPAIFKAGKAMVDRFTEYQGGKGDSWKAMDSYTLLVSANRQIADALHRKDNYDSVGARRQVIDCMNYCALYLGRDEG